MWTDKPDRMAADSTPHACREFKVFRPDVSIMKRPFSIELTSSEDKIGKLNQKEAQCPHLFVPTEHSDHTLYHMFEEFFLLVSVWLVSENT